ncbi:MAG: TIGR02444 family protein [Burkholderiales bacterium]|nr:TIGR02444 family protein [Burkholderiales bacterium]
MRPSCSLVSYQSVAWFELAVTTRVTPSSFPFWRFSLRTYRAPGVAKACLALQNSCGADVNLLLYGCWLGRSGRRMNAAATRRALAAAARWQSEVRHAANRSLTLVGRRPFTPVRHVFLIR